MRSVPGSEDEELIFSSGREHLENGKCEFCKLAAGLWPHHNLQRHYFVNLATGDVENRNEGCLKLASSTEKSELSFRAIEFSIMAVWTHRQFSPQNV